MQMNYGVQRERWAHTATITAVLINSNRDPKKPAIKVSELMPRIHDPSKVRSKPRREMAPITLLKEIFIDRGIGRR